jgi:phycoerythrin-associated linker protein
MKSLSALSKRRHLILVAEAGADNDRVAMDKNSAFRASSFNEAAAGCPNRAKNASTRTRSMQISSHLCVCVLAEDFAGSRCRPRNCLTASVPFNKLLETQQMIHRQGGRVASVSPVN